MKKEKITVKAQYRHLKDKEYQGYRHNDLAIIKPFGSWKLLHLPSNTYIHFFGFSNIELSLKLSKQYIEEVYKRADQHKINISSLDQDNAEGIEGCIIDKVFHLDHDISLFADNATNDWKLKDVTIG